MGIVLFTDKFLATGRRRSVAGVSRRLASTRTGASSNAAIGSDFDAGAPDDSGIASYNR
jgi:hypothetical protein